ncbi:flagellar filament capping protein FliD [Citrobacter freundii complex sp. 2024EL-00228]|jgi:flagellar hook-associated protein 2|uniref:Flagellar hook-associated protein 2 n=1 Tax=Citrobacter freundii TaxID=546 RepID=A0A9P3ZBZ1_CITFR|nr:flagellar filament capping protein FliD [Citrobacter freundii]EJC8214188.1 flagellar filament capping protein FliD [Citrobacter freundii]ELK7554578.1 flagellar filament capping protein FliD [Citrobacter freundii]ELK7555955.1 flagellar filament capping protein FliD [Citrobacter freundii]MBJ9312010.1 flagellar filament capping protein FliD [Citrobacter freundii]MDH1412565.1 flagellar filament capping protein FliD [Citrobacter freundii]
MINPRTMAKAAAYADIATQSANLQQQQAELNAESSGLDSLSTALTDFQSAIDALNSDTDGPLTFSATSNNDSATVSANSEAQAGTYSFYVSKLAQGQQSTFQMTDNFYEATGTFDLTMEDGSSMEIDLSTADSDGDGYIDATGLVDAINSSDDNPGVSAALVKTDGQTTIMLTSDTTGAQSGFTATVNGTVIASPETAMTTPQDAVINLGGKDGPAITSSSNTFDDVIPGVTMTFTEVSDPDDTSDVTTITVAEDSSASQAKVQTFVDAYNTLVDTVDSLTSNGGDGSNPGVFAGDAGISSLTNQLDDIAHSYYDGVSIVDYGISLDSDGHLEIDSDKFNEAMEANPDGLTSIFVGDDSMVAQMDNLMDSYLDSSTGIITMREDNIEDQQSKIQDESDQLTETYNTNYERYLEEYTNTLIETYTMKVSMAAFM